MNELSLFTGAGGGLLGTRLLGFRVVCAVEIDPYCREVLLRRQEEGILEAFPIWDDIGTFNGIHWRGIADVITAGFPCQPFSVAGKRKGKMDERNLWPDTIRVIREVRPRYCLLENVPGLISCGYIGTILQDLSESGYDARWKVISAAEVGAPYKRDRLWIVANSQGAECQQSGRTRTGGQRFTDNSAITWWDTDPADIPDSPNETSMRGNGKLSTDTGTGYTQRGQEGNGFGRPTQPFVGRVATRVAYRVDRLRALGNGQIPRVVEMAWQILTQ